MGTSALDRLLAPPLDRELKRYTVLAFVQRMEACFADHKLYPHLNELGACVQDLRALEQQRDQLEAAMPKEIGSIDLRRMKLRYAPMPTKPEGLLVIEEVISMALPKLSRTLDVGRELRAELVQSIRFSPVGVLPLHVSEGYLMLRQGSAARVYTYSFHRLRAEDTGASHVNLTTRYVATWTVGLACTYESIKRELVRALPLPNPATFAFEADAPLPPVETFLPLAKQLVYEEVKSGELRMASGE
ncbi:MAG: hypothetical protein ABI599_16805 [Flavobacteriales bacterium]